MFSIVVEKQNFEFLLDECVVEMSYV